MLAIFLFITFISSTNSLNCSSTPNFLYGRTTTVKTIPANRSQFLSIAGDFYNITWYGYLVKSTVGPTNQINSVRTATSFDNKLTFRETLIEYTLNDTYFKQSWKGPGDEIGTVNIGNFILGSYVESLSAESTCQGSAVLINFDIEFCATNVPTATKFLEQDHINGIQQIQTLLGIGNDLNCH